MFGHSYVAAHVWFCVLSALTCAALYAFGRAGGQAHIGLGAALLLAVYPPHAYLAMHFFSETPFALILIAAVMIVTPWMMRNANVIGAPTVSTLVGGYTFWGANNTVVLSDPAAYGSWVFDSRLTSPYPPLVGPEPEREREAWRRGLDFVRDHPREMPGLVIARWLRLAAPFQATPNRAAYYALGIPWLCVAPFFVFGVFRALREHLAPAVIAIVPIAATIATASVFYGSVRFRDAVAPQLLWFAAVGLAAAVAHFRRERLLR